MELALTIVITAFAALALWLAARYVFGGDAEDISYDQAARILAEEKRALLLDVRTAREHQTRRPVGAHNIPLQELKQRLTELEPYRQYSIVVICASGMRSRMAVQTLRKQGFSGVKNFRGGITNWQGELESG
ncbi:rhodanese-like domain-containing protein [Heliobacterium gestii]|uniref:Rhodanese-like domain-containing protein n=1 Tax=Heliomicrobium gestii TaxID=2699 RepID=A0A845L9I9_HELGE|nr:rhodanese-like domain-containing protein [Heliomicrobium gestii]MBM7866822.1 rhodanese-related sulfurtransferase [Heliomicrobium gestii]MZP42251.1 rhodanese-like domain-containing protein [Heliomicrobium gestii]